MRRQWPVMAMTKRQGRGVSDKSTKRPARDAGQVRYRRNRSRRGARRLPYGRLTPWERLPAAALADNQGNKIPSGGSQKNLCWNGG